MLIHVKLQLAYSLMFFDSLNLFFFLIRDTFEYILVEGKAVDVCKVKNESPPGMGIEGTSVLFLFYYGAGVVLVIMNAHVHVLPKDEMLEVEF